MNQFVMRVQNILTSDLHQDLDHYLGKFGKIFFMQSGLDTLVEMNQPFSKVTIACT